MNFIELKNKLQQPYDQSNWVEWLQDIFGLQVSIDTNPDTLIIEKGNAKSVHRFASLQMSDDRHIAILDIVTSSSVQIARNRVALRDIVFKLIDQDKYHGLLVFYHSEDVRQSDYRLSFISSQSTFDSEGNFITQSTHPKRYSFLLGPNESCYTAAQRLRELKNKVPPFKAFELQKGISLQDLQDAFSVEKLNKEFFKQYKEVHYTKFWQYIASHETYADLLIDHKQQDQEKKEKPIRDWVKKMLGRIVFLHFLQKKGWMACPSDTDDWKYGDHSFMYNLFDRCPHQNHFYSKVLTPLFFKTLNSRRSGDLIPDVFSYYRDIQITKHDNVENLKIPYLNGGLFENVDQQCNKIDFPSEYFADLLEFFQQYNFTIDENSPDEQEVGIDPEMLGHIFENLLEENKDKGAFYTPKEIVHYMCQESLIEYLSTHLPECKEDDAPETVALQNFIRNDEIGDPTNSKNYIVANAEQIEQLLDQVKICDPAIGSGAFPMGMLQEIFKAKMTLDLTQDKVAVKKGIIQNSIYGVDLESGAVDIARLRFWLSLVVDEDKPEPLPNLDYKIMQGNSLLESYEGIDLSQVAIGKDVKVVGPEKDLFGNIKESQMKMTFSDSKISQEVQKLIQLYFSIENAEQKATTKDKINKAVFKHIDYNIELRENQLHRWIAEAGDYNNLKKTAKKKYDQWKNDLDTLEKTKTNLIELQKGTDRPFFLWHLFFADVFSKGGFDIVIGNPPYIQLQKIKSEANKLANVGYQTFERTGDIYCIFYELGGRLLKRHGCLCYITNSSWMRTLFGKSLRNYFLTEINPIKLIDLSDSDIFKTAVVLTNILLFKKEKNNSILNAVRVTKKHNDILSEGLNNVFEKDKVKLTNLDTSSWTIVEKQDQLIINKVIEKGKKLRDWDIEINIGILNGLNEAFVIDREKKAELESIDRNAKRIIFPMLRGRDMKKFAPEFSGKYLINTFNGYTTYKSNPDGSRTKIKVDRVDVVKDYPGIFNHLSEYKEKAIKRHNQGDHWTNLRNCAYNHQFLQPKVMYPSITKDLPFFYDESCYFSNDKSFIMVGEKLKFLTCILNSKLFRYCFENKFPELQGNSREIKKNVIEELQIIYLDREDLLIFFETIHDYLKYLYSNESLFISEFASNEDLGNLFEDSLNMMVFELYFQEHMKKNDIDILQFVDTEKYFLPINGKDQTEISQIIGNCYSWLQQENNPIRNRIMLADVRSKEIIGRINSATH